mmetsp:Transcript_40860/g.73422  ORF Transcript_40860/g.73422 Transcript_40860/m.73422 type:complete len:94 (+) Transcript_40860:482-763(+)|eukprot:CAMPEP_0177763674 /NCGR_PEP_ID=MMETSP0491_2-20121128/6993_1 /TAXON_ID=63592 /ORGANISM="Tetraselmis chuii, Strain PLY429" /LENGTH=93 /DNA_ID=CAMNT_0019279789 /DNA_START=433 /DNA_END=714 /DNA_ORIENTATION=+
MDFAGQKLSEQLAIYTTLFFALFSFLAGYLMSSFKLMMIIYAGGVTMAMVISVPDWPYFNQNPLKWLDPIETEGEGKATEASLAKKGAKKSKK